MFTCPVCSKCCLNSKDIQLHLKFKHNYGRSNFPGHVCPEISCTRKFSTWCGLLKHLKFHNNNVQREEEIYEEESNNELGLGPDDISDIVEDSNVCYDPDKLIIYLLTNFCSSLMSRGVSNSVVDYVVKELDYCFSQVSKIIIKLASKYIVNNLADFSLELESLLSALDKLKTGYSRQKLYETTNKIVNPVEITLGTRVDLKLKDTKREQVLVPETFMYVPILETLERIFSENQYSKYLLNPPKIVSFYEKFSDSQSFKSNILFKNFPNAIQIQLFYDDFEPANPIGPVRSVHKIGGIYFIIRNFPDYINSQLNQIHLLALFHTEDAKKYGISSILKYIIPDIKILETVGLLVRNERVFGTVCCLVHDNLGGNTLLGFMESFNANYYCRICCTSRNEAQDTLDHNNMVLRDRVNYTQHLIDSNFGVVRECELNNLYYFNFLDSPTVDIMHDLLEGVVPYEIKLVIQKLISMGSFTLEEINNRIMCHDFGFLESRNKPWPLRLDLSGNKLGQKAAQAWCLVRFLPIIIGDLIVTEDQLKYWELILQLLECMSLIFCRKFSESTIETMHSSIIRHHELFKTLFPERKLIPKHHFMTHYSYVIRKSGPLINLWAMRFEGKHNYFVQLVSQIKSYKNICLSLANRHQQHMSHVISRHDLSDDMKIDIIFPVLLSQISDSFDLIELLRGFKGCEKFDEKTSIFTTNQVWFRGYNYRYNFVVCYEIGPVFPKFGIISEFIVLEDNCCLILLQELEVKYFYRNLFAYKLSPVQDRFKLINISSLVIHDAMEIQNNCKLDGMYVICRHHL